MRPLDQARQTLGQTRTKRGDNSKEKPSKKSRRRCVYIPIPQTMPRLLWTAESVMQTRALQAISRRETARAERGRRPREACECFGSSQSLWRTRRTPAVGRGLLSLVLWRYTSHPQRLPLRFDRDIRVSLLDYNVATYMLTINNDLIMSCMPLKHDAIMARLKDEWRNSENCPACFLGPSFCHGAEICRTFLNHEGRGMGSRGHRRSCRCAMFIDVERHEKMKCVWHSEPIAAEPAPLWQAMICLAC